MSEDVKLESSVGIIGAGIQGVCIALCLIKKGFRVTLIDRDDPGKDSASYGNAGHFSPKFDRTLSFKMELCAKDDSMVFKIHKELY